MSVKSLCMISIVSIVAIIVGHDAAVATEYQYDYLGRLINCTLQDGVSIHYSYDQNGNRTSKTITSPALSAPYLQIYCLETELILQWSEVPGALSYRVESANANGGSWSTLTTVTGTSWIMPSSDGAHFYRVVAQDTESRVSGKKRGRSMSATYREIK